MENPYKLLFNTALTKEEQLQYRKWLMEESNKEGYDKSEDMEDYDLQGFWKDQVKSGKWKGGHGTDRYKKPNHPTFSTQSMYSGKFDPIQKQVVVGGVWSGNDKLGFTYSPSQQQIQRQGYVEYIQQYFNSPAEKGKSTLNLKGH